MIRAVSRSDFPADGVEFYWRMRWEGVVSNYLTLSFCLDCFTENFGLIEGMQIHGRVLVYGYVRDCVLMTLMDLYSLCGLYDDACKVFEDMPHRENARARCDGYSPDAKVAADGRPHCCAIPDDEVNDFKVKQRSISCSCIYKDISQEGRGNLNDLSEQAFKEADVDLDEKICRSECMASICIQKSPIVENNDSPISQKPQIWGFSFIGDRLYAPKRGLSRGDEESVANLLHSIVVEDDDKHLNQATVFKKDSIVAAEDRLPPVSTAVFAAAVVECVPAVN
ncbi:pentatricopeptide repeat-containing protein At5g48910-like [Spinacia oleracea]|uniref:Pentatricopeptide repeat-containing protein At5g48910-like n=1 Tax=Spinacia oleracea TaxID=3562 RepID=A0ABM3R924_SPIOL|nr:pentatricopeptide repeat-containing protein At5g48910-like [Spinacia oleracea]